MQTSPLHPMDPRMAKIPPGTSSRILYDIPCRVCQDHSSGKHYGIFACDGCAGFFKRSIRRQRQYVCKAKAEGSCLVDKAHRNQCRACRLRKCLEAGMNKDVSYIPRRAPGPCLEKHTHTMMPLPPNYTVGFKHSAVQHERGPRNSTLRRQMALFFKEPGSPTPPSVSPLSSMHPPVLDLALPKGSGTAPSDLPPSAAFFCVPPPKMQQLPLCLPVPLETVCESAARLLFMNVKWAKSVPAFTSLNIRDQLLLLEESWRELFVLGASQFMLPIELSEMLLALGQRDALLHEVKVFQETLNKFKQLQVDQHEYACLRAIVLFKTAFEGSSGPSSSGVVEASEVRTLRDMPAVAALQDHTQLTLNKYIGTAYPTQPFRFGKLLLLLPALRSVSAVTIEELFFRRTIGHIPIARIICDMYKSNDL